MRVIISAGGTGGHIYPALAIINKIKEVEPDSKILYIGTHNRMEKDLVPKYNIPYSQIEIYGFNKKNLIKNFKTIGCIFKGYQKCKKLIKQFKPDIVIGAGGYVTVPVILAAHKLGIKTFIHEQNSVPGKANMFLSSKVDLIGVSFKSTMNEFATNNLILTGNPCADMARKLEPASKKEFGLSEKKKLVYIVMGSLGSSWINNLLIDSADIFKDKNYEILFVTGRDFYDEIKDKKLPDNFKIVPYVDNQTRIIKKCDLMVTRCGATTISEMAALGIASILIPSPYVADNHQYKNGLDLVNKNAAIMIEECDLTIEKLVDSIDNIIDDEEKLNNIRKNISSLYVKNSSRIIYDEIKNLIGRK